MSIADKLIYLNTTKEKLKDSINNIGGSITDETTFRAYATELDNIYDNLPKTTGEGSNLSLTTLKGRINVDDIKGDTEQDTYEGYNLLPVTTPDGTYYGVTFKNNDDGTITLNGTPTTSNAINIFEGEISLSGDYVFYLYGNDGSISCSALIDNTTTTLFGFSSSSSTTTKNYTSSKMTRLYLWVTPDHPYTNKIIKPMLVKGTDTTKLFQKYVGGQASPNPTYPQDINVVTGTQEVVVQNKNMMNGYWKNGGTTISTKTSANRLHWVQNLYVESGKAITFSTNLDTSVYKYAMQTYNASIYNSSGDSTLTDSNKILDSGWKTTSSFTYTTTQNCYVTILMGRIDNTNFAPTSVSDKNFQIELGSTATSYIEHQEQTKTISLGDIELCKIGDYEDTIEYDVENDKVYKNKRIEKYQITGSNETEGWNDSGISGVAFISKITNYATINNKVFCTHFKGESNSNGAGGMQDYGNNTIAFGNQSGSVAPRLYIKKTDITTLELRTLLQEKKPMLYYALATEVKEEITGTLKDQIKALYNLKSYNGVTNISSSGNLPMILDVTALKGE